MPKKRVSRKQKERLRHRREILEAACRVFAVKGYDGATLGEIAEEADFAISTLYNFFPSKEHIFQSLINDKIVEFLSLARSRIAHIARPLDRIKECTKTTIEFVKENPEFFRFFFNEKKCLDLKFRQDETTPRLINYDELIRFFHDLFDEAIRAKEIADLDAMFLTVGFMGMLYGMATYWIQEGAEDSRLLDAGAILKIFFEDLTSR